MLNFYRYLYNCRKVLLQSVSALLLIILLVAILAPIILGDSSRIQVYSNIATVLALIVAVTSFASESVANREERKFSAFLKFMDAYEKVKADRRARWIQIQEVVKQNPNTQHEITGRTSTLQYLLLRANQDEPLYPAEHGLLEVEIKGMNLLNELCRYSLAVSHKMLLIKSLFADDISFYKNHLQILLGIRDKESIDRLFSIPRYDSLLAIDIGNFLVRLQKKVRSKFPEIGMLRSSVFGYSGLSETQGSAGQTGFGDI